MAVTSPRRRARARARPGAGPSLRAADCPGAAESVRAGPVRVMVVDDQILFRQALRALFDLEADIEVVAEAGTAEEAVRRAAAAAPDVVLLDLRLPDRSGTHVVREVHGRNPAIAVLVLTAYPDERAVFSSIEAGAAGYLLKTIEASELVSAVRRAKAGDAVLDPSVTTQVLGRLRSGGSAAAPDDRLARLTPTEARILRLVADGFANREIASELGYAESTVKNYVSSILAKLEVSRRTQAAAYLVAHSAEP